MAVSPRNLIRSPAPFGGRFLTFASPNCQVNGIADEEVGIGGSASNQAIYFKSRWLRQLITAGERTATALHVRRQLRRSPLCRHQALWMR